MFEVHTGNLLEIDSGNFQTIM